VTPTLTISFLIACFFVVYGGIKLTKIGDQFEDVGISSGFVGTVLLALITSLPEFVATFSSIYRLDAPQLALGNIFGSNTFNLAILAVMDLFFIREVLYHRVDRFIAKSLAVGQIMTVLALAGIFLNSSAFVISVVFNAEPFLKISVFNFLIFVVYILAFRLSTVVDGDPNSVEEEKEPPNGELPTSSSLGWKFFLYAVVVVIAGIWLTDTCDQISEATGLGKTFIGSILLAFATSLPEATVCITAMRLFNYSLVFGNILGSNVFNLFILSLADLFTPKIALMETKHVELNYITGFGSLLMSAVVLLALSYRGKRKVMKSLSLSLIIVYFVAYYIMFQMNSI
jgi:cation:H+ antiporter